MFFERLLKKLHKESEKGLMGSPAIFNNLAKSHVYFITEKFLKDLDYIEIGNQKDDLILTFSDGIFLNFEKPLRLDHPLNPEQHPILKLPMSNKLSVKAIHIEIGNLIYRKNLSEDVVIGKLIDMDEWGEQGLHGLSISLICGVRPEESVAFTVKPWFGTEWLTRFNCQTICTPDSYGNVIPYSGHCKFRGPMLEATNKISEEEYNKRISDTSVCSSDLTTNCPLMENSWTIVKLMKKIIWSLIYHPIEYKPKDVTKSKHKSMNKKAGGVLKEPKIPRLTIVETKPLQPTVIAIDPQPKPPELPKSAREYSSPVTGHYRCYTYCEMCGKRIKVNQRHLTECPKCRRELNMKEEFSWVPDHWSPIDPRLPRVNSQHNVEV